MIIYQSSKFSFLCVLLVESVSREIEEIKLSPSHQRAREIMHYSPVIFFRFFDSWYIIKYLLTETSGKQYVLWTLDCRCFNIDSLGSTNILFPSVSVNKC